MRVLSILGDPHPKGRSWSTNPTREGSRTLISMEVKQTTLPMMSKFYARWATRSIIFPAGFFRGALSRVPADRGHGPAGRWATGLNGRQARFRTDRQAGTRDRSPGCDRLIGLKKQEVPGMIKSSHSKRIDR